jgi:hypothetical protein
MSDVAQVFRPAVSVIIATRNRAALLAQTLDALDRAALRRLRRATHRVIEVLYELLELPDILQLAVFEGVDEVITRSSGESEHRQRGVLGALCHE